MSIEKGNPAETSAIDHFGRRGYRERMRVCAFAPLADPLVSWLAAQGYSRNGIYETLRHLLRFSEFAEQGGVSTPAQVTDELVDGFVDTWVGRPRAERGARICASRLLRFFRESGWTPPAPNAAAQPAPRLVDEYLRYLTQHRGIGERHAKRHRAYATLFLEDLDLGSGDKIAKLGAEEIFDFVTQRARALSLSGSKSMCSTLRSFLRFLHVRGFVGQDLTSTVPVIPSFKLARLPVPIRKEAVEKILEAVDRSTPQGRRDFAMLLLLATYGLRSSQVLGLRLEDVDWRRETLRIRGVKDGFDVLLPLRRPVGSAIVDYLRQGRPGGPFREIFLRVRAPIGPLTGTLRNVIKPYASKAGLTGVPLGPHAWRHGCATQMLSCGQSLKTIRETLGHRSIETTFIYAKVDTQMLRRAALEWPEPKP